MNNVLVKIIITSLLIFTSACGGGGGGGGSCNVAAGQLCDLGKYCVYSNNSCGRDGSSGSCQDIPTSCSPGGAAVCTCDGLTFFNECFAAQAGQSIQAVGECP